MSPKETVTAKDVKVVAAIGTASGKAPIGRDVQTAMEDAIRAAYKEGITDPKIIKQRMMSAREAVRAALAEEAKQKAKAISEAKKT